MSASNSLILARQLTKRFGDLLAVDGIDFEVAKGEAFGLSVRVVTDHVQRVTPLSDGSFGWSGAFGTHFWVDPKEKVVGVLMVQTNNPNRQLDRDLENAVMQAIVE